MPFLPGNSFQDPNVGSPPTLTLQNLVKISFGACIPKIRTPRLPSQHLHRSLAHGNFMAHCYDKAVCCCTSSRAVIGFAWPVVGRSSVQICLDVPSSSTSPSSLLHADALLNDLAEGELPQIACL